MNKQECIETMDIALKYLGWQGGTVWQIADELYKRTGVIRKDAVHVHIKDMLVKLGVLNDY